jgi:hypothetical protein
MFELYADGKFISKHRTEAAAKEKGRLMNYRLSRDTTTRGAARRFVKTSYRIEVRGTGGAI